MDRDYPWTEVEQDVLEREWERRQDVHDMFVEFYDWLDSLPTTHERD